MSKGEPIKLTIPRIENMKEGEELWDAIITGLHVRALKKGKSMLYSYTTLGGIRRRPLIGKYASEVTLDEAREIAKNWAHEVALGNDPALTREQLKDATPPGTIADLKAKWDFQIDKGNRLEDGTGAKLTKEKKKDLRDLKPSTVYTYKIYWQKLIDKFGEKKLLNSITKEMVEDYHNDLGEEIGPTTANRMLEFISSVMNLALQWGMREASLGNPAVGLAKFKLNKRERILTQDEAPMFGKVLYRWLKSGDDRHKHMARLIFFCLFNGARRSEFMKARLSWIDWDIGVMALPDSKTGAKKVGLNPLILPLLIDRYNEWVAAGAIEGHDWIIPGKHPYMHLITPNKGWYAFLKEAGIKNFHLHDLRHSFASIAIGSGAGAIDQVGGVLGHSSDKTTKRYIHAIESRTRQVQEKTGTHILEMFGGQAKYRNELVPEAIKQQRETLKIAKN